MAIPTLTDIGNRIVQGVGTLTGQIRNPFTEQIEELESRLQATNNEDEIVKLNDQLRTLRAASDEWSGYDVAKQDPTAAPEWLQGIYGLAKTAGDNFDLVDVGTSFIPVGAVTKGARLAASGLKKAGKGIGTLAGKYVGNVAEKAGARAGEKAAEQVVKNSKIGPKVQKTLRNMEKEGMIDRSLKTKDVKRAESIAEDARKKAAAHNELLEKLDRDRIRANRLAADAEEAFAWNKDPLKSARLERRADRLDAIRENVIKRLEEERAFSSGAAGAAEEAKNVKDAFNNLKRARAAAREEARRGVNSAARNAYTRAANRTTTEAAAEAANSAIARGLTAAGEGASRFGTGVERGAEWLASHPVLSEAGEQALIEGAHGAASYNPEYGPSMGLNALEQGGLAGLMQGGISALGGRRLRAINALPENIRVKEGLDNLRGLRYDVPNYSPVRMSEKTPITPKEYNNLFEDATTNAAFASRGDFSDIVPKGHEIDIDQYQNALSDTEKDMRQRIAQQIRKYGRVRRDVEYPELDQFKSPKYRSSEWSKTHEWPEPIETDDLYSEEFSSGPFRYRLKDAIAGIYNRPRSPETAAEYFSKKPNTVAEFANNQMARRLLEMKGLNPDIVEEIGRAVEAPREVMGLAGLKYAPLPKGAVRNKLADVYSAQTDPLNSFGAARYRAAYNALLDAAREGGLAGLYGLGYLDGEEE